MLREKEGLLKSLMFSIYCFRFYLQIQKLNGYVRHLLHTNVSGNVTPCAKVIVEQLLECSGMYGFESDSGIFNYLLNSFARFNKITDVVEC
jgi:hypothetical protein